MGMEGDDAGRGKTVPCLVAVRCVVAMAVGAVAFAVVVMVIVMVRRPEEIQLAISQGQITMEWGDLINIGSVGDSHRRLLTFYGMDTTDAGNETHLTIGLTFSNPSGRGHDDKNFCGNITVGLVDIMLSPSAFASSQLPEGITETITRFTIDNDFFRVPKESSHTEVKKVTINNKTGEYIRDRLSHEDVFQVLVMVHMFTSPKNCPPSPPPTPPPTPPITSNKEKHKYKDKNNDKYQNVSPHTFYCWPITVGSAYSDLRSNDDVQCKKSGTLEVPDPKP